MVMYDDVVHCNGEVHICMLLMHLIALLELQWINLCGCFII